MEKEVLADEERDRKISRCADALLWCIEHPDAPVDPVLKEYVKLVEGRLAAEEKCGGTGQKSLGAG